MEVVTAGMGGLENSLVQTASIVLQVRMGMSYSQWDEVAKALDSANQLTVKSAIELHPCAVEELMIAKEALAYWKCVERQTAKQVNQSFNVSMSLQNGQNFEVHLSVSGAEKCIKVCERKERGPEMSVSSSANLKKFGTSASIFSDSLQSFQVLIKDIHTVFSGSANKRQLTLVTEKEETIDFGALQKPKIQGMVPQRKAKKVPNAGAGALIRTKLCTNT